VASRLLPLLVATSPRERQERFAQWLTALAPEIERLGVALAGAADGWAAESIALHTAFWSARRTREQAIAASMDADDALKQAGLFDRRELRAAADAAARAAAIAEEAGRKAADADAAAALQATMGIALLLLPGRRW
jgi:hypothetical protein